MVKLQAITIGNKSFRGDSDDECVLKLSSISLIVLLHLELETLVSLTIGEHSFEWVKELKIANLTHLKKLEFGVGSFGSSLDGSFEVRYCGKAVKFLDNKPYSGKGGDKAKKGSAAKKGNTANKGNAAKKSDAGEEGFLFRNGSFMHWKEFIISDCSIRTIKIGVDCFMRCEYAVFNGQLVVGFNDI